ncbi:hypothetical protein [Streptomyces hundungensis]|uniref:hypothetical protein n=1 Tax=Streptomyces hundungensis TaxID=1077946 RepID=UPI0031EF282C
MIGATGTGSVSDSGTVSGTGGRYIRVPVGDEAARWAARGRCKRVLFVVHNVTSATRLLDVLPLFHDDLGIQLLATCTGSSAFEGGVDALLAETGVPVLPWEQALETKVDLAITASLGGQLHRISGKLTLLSHGVGYNKTLATPDTGHRTPDTGHQTPDTGHPSPEGRASAFDSPSGANSAVEPTADMDTVAEPDRDAQNADVDAEADTNADGAPAPKAESAPTFASNAPPASATCPSLRNDPAPGPAPVFGLSPDWLLHKGIPIADAMVLSHPEQLDRLRTACPEAAATAVLAGDPCFDRMLAARPYRERFRKAFGVRRGQRLVVLNSTWNPESLFGDGGGADVFPSLLPRLTAELPADEYRVAAVLHPNIWHGHGPGQIRAWLDRALRAGLVLVDPLHDWRQALLAADAVIGDHGSVSYYAAALGLPVLLGAAPAGGGLDPQSPVAQFVGAAPRFDPHAPLAAHLDDLMANHSPLPGPAHLTTSAPGASATLLRALFYRLLDTPEPERPALLEPLRLPPHQRPFATAPLRVLTRVTTDPYVIHLARHADPWYEPAGEGHVHMATPEDTRDPGQLPLSDVLLREAAADDLRFGSPEQWTAEVLARHPHSSLAAYITGPHACTVRTRTGRLLRLTGDPDGLDPGASASALHAWLTAGRTIEEALETGLTVRTGHTTHRVRVTIPTTGAGADMGAGSETGPGTGADTASTA